ncbi:MAG: hypothetical protein JO042_10045 [Sinobacteraceae bacterium]|nr:hypothetical protein [Nevskiaceae bacterium]
MHWLDPDHLPHVGAQVERFLLNPRGDADGMILSNGLEVHFPPHLSRAVLAAVTPGDTVRVYGVRPRGAEMISAVLIETDDGQRILDEGPGEPKEKKHKDPDSPPKHRAMEAHGLVQRVLHGPKGEVRGVLLNDGTIARIDPDEIKGSRRWLVEGQPLAVKGDGLVSEHGTIIRARSISASAG